MQSLTASPVQAEMRPGFCLCNFWLPQDLFVYLLKRSFWAQNICISHEHEALMSFMLAPRLNPFLLSVRVNPNCVSLFPGRESKSADLFLPCTINLTLNLAEDNSKCDCLQSDIFPWCGGVWALPPWFIPRHVRLCVCVCVACQLLQSGM